MRTLVSSSKLFTCALPHIDVINLCCLIHWIYLRTPPPDHKFWKHLTKHANSFVDRHNVILYSADSLKL